MNVDHYLLTEGDRIVYDISDRVMAKSVWPGIVRRKPWPEKMGVNPSNVEWQRPFVENENEWADVVLNNGTGTQCLPPTDVVEINRITRDMKLQQKAIESPDFCVTDLIFTEARDEQMGKIVDSLSEQARWNWIKRIRREYHRVSRNKIILEAGLTGHGVNNEDDEGFPVGALPTSMLVNGALDFFYRELILEGAAEDAITMSQGKPVFALITDVFTSRKLTRADDAIREDIRQSDENNSLLGPLGIDCTYNGFLHLIDEMPRRWDWVAVSDAGSGPSGWVERAPYIKVGTGPIATIEVNPDWVNAAYQDSYIFCPGVMNLLVPPSISGAAGAEYEYQNYVGDFKFRNIASRADNPDENMGFFRGKLMSGTEFVKPQWGYVIRHQVCDRDLGLIACA